MKISNKQPLLPLCINLPYRAGQPPLNQSEGFHALGLWAFPTTFDNDLDDFLNFFFLNSINSSTFLDTTNFSLASLLIAMDESAVSLFVL